LAYNAAIKECSDVAAPPRAAEAKPPPSVAIIAVAGNVDLFRLLWWWMRWMLLAQAASKWTFSDNEKRVHVAIAIFAHFPARGIFASDSEVRLVFHLGVLAFPVDTDVRCFDMQVAPSTCELTSLIHRWADCGVIAISDKVFACGFWTISKADACVNSIKA
jgi:hypothetical protein